MSRSLRLSEEEYRSLVARRTPKPEKLQASKPKERRPESELERLFALQLREAGFTEADDDAPMRFAREFKAIEGRDFRLDFAWPALRVAVEIQGAVHRIKDRWKRESERRALHLLAGWRVLEVNGDDVRSGRALEWTLALLKLK